MNSSLFFFQGVDFLRKKNPGAGICPVRGCRKHLGNKKGLCDKHHQLAWRIKHPIQAAWHALRSSARQRKIFFDLTLEQFRAFVEPTRYMDEKGRSRYALHIDRIKEHLGYTLGNLQVITNSENATKENDRRKQYIPYFQTEKVPQPPVYVPYDAYFDQNVYPF